MIFKYCKSGSVRIESWKEWLRYGRKRFFICCIVRMLLIRYGSCAIRGWFLGLYGGCWSSGHPTWTSQASVWNFMCLAAYGTASKESEVRALFCLFQNLISFSLHNSKVDSWSLQSFWLKSAAIRARIVAKQMYTLHKPYGSPGLVTCIGSWCLQISTVSFDVLSRRIGRMARAR